MQQQPALLFYRFQYLFASLFVLAFLVLTSALVTTFGAHTVLDPRSGAAVHSTPIDLADDPNAVTNSASWLLNGTRQILLTSGVTLYSACRGITAAATHTGQAIAHGSATIVRGTWHGIAFTIRGIGSGVAFVGRSIGAGVMFTIHLPGHLMHPLTSGHGVRSIIRPSEDTAVPVITDETSTEALANLSAQQQQQIMSLITAQIAANKDLGGTVVAGDPNHGGYPAKWDAPARQDSRLDSWGMYNRECVSYAAWKVYQTYGSMPYWGGVGNANQWVRDARRAGIATGSTPAVHSVAISMRGYYGHAMWVEKVSGDMIYVSQYNYDLHGHYSEMWLRSSDLTYIYFK
jgi:surface antigen